jgi:hypothetical protein
MKIEGLPTSDTRLTDKPVTEADAVAAGLVKGDGSGPQRPGASLELLVVERSDAGVIRMSKDGFKRVFHALNLDP